jgi:hypothetical protein
MDPVFEGLLRSHLRTYGYSLKPIRTDVDDVGNPPIANRELWTVVGCAVVAWCVAICGTSFCAHLQTFRAPNFQILFLRIHLLIPLYALTALLTIEWIEWDGLFELIRALYEPYALWVLFQLMIAYAGGRDKIFKEIERNGARFVICPCFPSFVVGTTVIATWSTLVAQFMVVKPFVSSLCWHYRRQHEEIQHDALLRSISVCSMLLAMTGLLNAYLTLSNLLAPLHILKKFLTLKLIVFVTVWQEITVHFLIGLGVIESVHCSGSDKDDLHCHADLPNRAVRLVAICVLLEMLLSSPLFYMVFSANDPALGEVKPTKSTCENVKQVFALWKFPEQPQVQPLDDEES